MVLMTMQAMMVAEERVSDLLHSPVSTHIFILSPATVYQHLAQKNKSLSLRTSSKITSIEMIRHTTMVQFLRGIITLQPSNTNPNRVSNIILSLPIYKYLYIDILKFYTEFLPNEKQ
jgi:hypothetical protein